MKEQINQTLRQLLPGYEPYAFMIDRNQDRDHPDRPRPWLHRAGFVHGLPRLLLRCRLLGHRPVVDGTPPVAGRGGYVSQAYMWVRCERCSVRGEPQGSLDPYRYRIGQRYAGPWGAPTPKVWHPSPAREAGEKPLLYPPGRIDAHPTGKLGVEVWLGRHYPGWGWEVKIGSRHSEHTLAANVRLGWLGGVYVHTEGFGSGLVELLNRGGDNSRLTGMHLGTGQAGWRLWSRRLRGYEDIPHEPWWQKTDIDLRLLDRLLGPKQYHYTPVGEPVHRVVRMPEGDYLVKLRLEERVHHRRRHWRTPKVTWSVDWTAADRQGIPTKPGDRGQIQGSAVTVSAQSVRQGMWPAEAAVAIALKLTQMRGGYRWEPAGNPQPRKEVTM